MEQQNAPIQSIQQIVEILAQIKLDWNDVFTPNTLHDSLKLFQQVIDVASDLRIKLDSIRASLKETRGASSIDYSNLSDNVKLLESKQKIAQILSTLESMNAMLTKADRFLAANDVAGCWNALTSFKRQLMLADAQPAYGELPHFSEMKQKYAKIKREFSQTLLGLLQTAILNPALHDDKQVLECLNVLNGNGDEFLTLYELLLANVKTSFRSSLVGKIDEVAKEIPMEKSFLQPRPADMNEVLHVFNSFENKMLERLFSHLTKWSLEIFNFFEHLLEIGQFKSDKAPFVRDDILMLISDQLLCVADCFARKSAVSNVAVYFDDSPDSELECKPNVAAFSLPDTLMIRNVDFAKSKFYQTMGTSDEGRKQTLISSTTIKVSLEAVCSKIAPKSSYYTNMFTKLFQFLGVLKEKYQQPEGATSQIQPNLSRIATESIATSQLNGLPAVQSRFETFYMTSFLVPLQSRITTCINHSFGISASFEPLLVDKELNHIFKLTPEICSLFEVLFVCDEHVRIMRSNAGGFISNDLSISQMIKDIFSRIMAKFESLFNFLFSERTSPSHPSAGNLIATKIVKSNSFFVALDAQAIDATVVKREFYSLFDFKKGRSFRKEELLELNKIEKILLFYHSLLWFHQRTNFSQLSDNSEEVLELKRSKLDFLIFKIIYTLRIEIMVQCVYYLELVLFDKNENIFYFLNQLVSFLSQLDLHCLRVIGPKCTQFLWKGLGAFLAEFFGSASKQLAVETEATSSSLSRIEQVMQHCLANLCCNESIQ